MIVIGGRKLLQVKDLDGGDPLLDILVAHHDSDATVYRLARQDPEMLVAEVR